MIGSSVFGYVNVLNKAADAAWKRNEVLANNIANNTTPGYKRKDVNFEEQLSRALRKTRYMPLDTRINNINGLRLRTKVHTDHAGFSYRLDGNNVDPDTEGVMLAANQLKYNGLIQSMNAEFANLKMVMRK
ncbi:MAG: flagellar basal body rod protein FlgB [Lachnospiraceae bacterium]|nr:flagellar basal body rod protein FlgB [Lachnospiraceae bacterium]